MSDAFDILEAEGLIITKAKSGSVVSINSWLSIIDGSLHEWITFLNLGSHVANSEEIYQRTLIMNSEPKVRLSGSAIHRDFNYSKPVKHALERVIKRIDETNEFNNINTMGLPALRQTIAKHMERNNIFCKPENILITGSPIESLSIIINSIMRRGLKFFHEKPSILNSVTFDRTMGLNTYQIGMDENGVDAEPFIDAIRKVRRDAVLYTNPVNHYPTGFSFSKKRRA